MKNFLPGLWFLALLSAASAQTLGPRASGPCSAFGTTAGTCAQGNAAVPYTGASGAVDLGTNQLNSGPIQVTANGSSQFPSTWIDTNTGGHTWYFGPGAGGGTSFNMWNTSFGQIFNWDYSTGTFTQVGPATYDSTMTVEGDFVTLTGTPTIASGACGTGTNGTITAGGDNQSMVVNIGAAATTSCAVSFSKTLGSAPKACLFSAANAAAAATTVLPRIATIATTGYTLTGAVLASTAFNVHCY